jgi:hypothetical protein
MTFDGLIARRTRGANQCRRSIIISNDNFTALIIVFRRRVGFGRARSGGSYRVALRLNSRFCAIPYTLFALPTHCCPHCARA